MIKKFDEYVNELWSKGIHRPGTGDVRKEDIVHPETKKELYDIIYERFEGDILPDTCNLNFIDTSRIDDMSYLFRDFGEYLMDIDISRWDVSNVESMEAMFLFCGNFRADLSGWNVSKVRDMDSMFANCRNFNSDLSRWDVHNCENMFRMFDNCKKFNSDLSKWDVSNVGNMEEMFNGCESLQCNFSGWDIDKAAENNATYDMFHGCRRLILPYWYNNED